MKIRNELAKNVVKDFVNDTFSRFDFNMTNVANAFIAKMYIHNNFDAITQIISKDGYIDIDALEEFAISDVERLGRIEIPAIGTKYIFNADDIKSLITRLKEKADA